MKKPVGWLVFTGIMVMMLGSLTVSAGGAQTPQPPIEVIRSAADRVMTILDSTPPSASGELKKKRRDEIVSVVYEFVDFREMAMRALGRHWKTQTEKKRDEFVPLFEKLLYNTYIDKVDSYTTGTERAVFDDQVIDGNYALVKGRIVGYKDKDVSVDYRLKLVNGQWKAYDVVIEGVSFISNYRSQFNAILAKSSFDSLLGQLQQKVAELEKKNQ